METKTHRLKTLQDIIDVVDENNMEFFLVDFRLFIVDAIKAKLLMKVVSAQYGEETEKLSLESFDWIEDGKHDNQGTTLKASNGKSSVTIDVNDTIQKLEEYFKLNL